MSDVAVPRASATHALSTHALSTHLLLLRSATMRSKSLSVLCWLAVFALLFGHAVHRDIQQQAQAFHETAKSLLQNASQDLRRSRQLQDDIRDIVVSGQPDRQIRIRTLANLAAQSQKQLYFVGYQPLVSPQERSGFERQQSHMLGKPYRIRDYLHDARNNWLNPDAWRDAPLRTRHLPLSMAEPGLASADWHEMGLDLLDDAVLAPAVNQALGHLRAVSPPLELHGKEPGIALLQTIYLVEPPSPVPMVRIEQAAGVILQVLYLKPLLALPTGMSNRYSLQLLRRDGAEQGQLIAQQAPVGGLSSWLPKLSQRYTLPELPYDFELTRQTQLERATSGEAAWCALLALLPAYLLWLALSLLEHNRRARERVQDDLYREREYASVALRSIGDAVISIDTQQVIQYLNPAAEVLLGLPASHALQRRLQQVAPLHYEFSRQPARDPVEQAVSTLQVVHLAQNCYLKRRGGEKLLVEGSVSPLLGRGGQLIGAVLTFRDTAPIRRRMLAALEASESRLRQHEIELARVARINTMGEMASGIAHEINQPLSAIMSYCQAALSLLEDEEIDMAMLQRALHSSVSQADRAGRIIHRLREFVTRKNQQLVPVQLNQSVHNALSLLDYELHEHDIHIEQNFAHELPLVYADTIQLEQVVLNLARNAVEAMEHTRPWGRLNITTRKQGERVQLIISDNGCGIPPDKLDRIFDPFFSTKPNGMGLGLAICQTAIEAFGGRLTAGNKPGSGAEFIIDLPCAARDVAASSGVEA